MLLVATSSSGQDRAVMLIPPPRTLVVPWARVHDTHAFLAPSLGGQDVGTETMNVWHLTPDTPREPSRVSAGELVHLRVGTWPIEPGQSVRVTYQVVARDGARSDGEVEATWQINEGPNSYWNAKLGPFSDGDHVAYHVRGTLDGTEAPGPSRTFTVGPKLYLALLWHQHQPIYKDTSAETPAGSYLHPWVRLHALRDYCSMAWIVGEHEGVHVTVNLSGSLLWQLADYLENGATDRALELTRKRAETLTASETEYVLSHFFEAHWHNQIAIHPRYAELFIRRRHRRRFSVRDLRDLQMWFNLAWFGKEFRESEIELVTGETASVKELVIKGEGFTPRDIDTMVSEQYKILRAVIPVHLSLQEQGRVEVTTTPFTHPILPLMVDTDQATIDRRGAGYPARFFHPEDADAQVERGIRLYRESFGRRPAGMWPAEGAVSASTVPVYARRGVRWIASDEGVLARSGRWGYDAGEPDVLCQPYRAAESGHSLSVFFRATRPSNAIGFDYHHAADYSEAAAELVQYIQEQYAHKLPREGDFVLTIVLDGENAWGSYRDDGRDFLRALYRLLSEDAEIRTVTFREYLDGNESRSIAPHPVSEQREVHDLFTGSWIDEAGSDPGVDLGTWIGEDEENRAWELLGATRAFLEAEAATPESAPLAFEALYMAEGSDWFWWFGSDQDSGRDEELDDLFRMHLRNVYRLMGAEPPPELDRHIVPHTVVWTHAAPVMRIQIGDGLTIRTHCPGRLEWSKAPVEGQVAAVSAVGGVMAGASRYQVTLGPFAEPGVLQFRFVCHHEGCPGTELCCDSRAQAVEVVRSA